MPSIKVEPTIPNYPPQGIQAQLDLLYLWNPDVANDLIEQLNKALEEVDADLSAYLTKAEAADTYATIAELAGMQPALTAEQLAAVNSGITAERVTTYNSYAAEISQAQTTADKADTAATVAQQTANLAGQNAAQALEDLKSKANTSDLPQNQTGTAGQVYTKTADGADWSTLDVYSKEETDQQIQNAIGTIETALAEV